VILVRHRRRLPIGALDQADPGPERQQLLHVARRAAQVGLEAETNRLVVAAQPPVEVDGRVRLRAVLHVQPEDAAGAEGHPGQPVRQHQGAARVEAQAQLRGLDRDVAGQALLTERSERANVLAGCRIRLAGVRDVLAQMGQHTRQTPAGERSGGSDCVLQPLARHEAQDGAARQPASRQSPP